MGIQRRLGRRMVTEGEKVPRGYGIAWDDYSTFEYVGYPVGLHLFARTIRQLWIAFKFYRHPNWWEQQLHKQFLRGSRYAHESHRDDYDRGVAAGMRFAKIAYEEMGKVDED